MSAAPTLSTATRRESKRFFRFLVVGTIGFVVDFGSFNILYRLLSVQPVLAQTISFCLAVTSNFTWNRLWTYPESRSKPIAKQFTQFFAMNLLGLGINLIVFKIVDSLLVPVVDLKLALAGAQVAAVTAAMFWNFGANRLVTYSDVKFGK